MSMPVIKRRITIIVGVVAAIIVATTASVAAGSHLQQGGSGPGTHQSISAATPTAVRVVTSTADFTTTSNTLVLIPSMTIKFTVGHTARLLMHFTDEAGCLSTTSGHWCTVEILVDGIEAAPAAGSDYAIDTSDGSGAYRWIGGALNRAIAVLAGTHTVTVEGFAVFSGDTFWSGENNLEVWIF
jgi:hypothetical protein